MIRSRLRAHGATLLAALAAGCARSEPTDRTIPPDSVPAAAPWTGVATALAGMIEHELADKQLPSLTVALVDGPDVVWARGFGVADPADSTPATAATVHRVGSVSKLFTDIGIMQRVERGELDLDAPVTRWIPDFAPADTFGVPITLRMMMAHRSGLLREPPEGNYFDADGSALEDMVASLNGRPLVYRPGTRTKYSNAAIATVGYVLQRVAGRPFAETLRTDVLEPLGLHESAFEPVPAPAGRLAKAEMWTLDGRTFDAPTFQLGMAPAGSMFSTVLDLGRFLSVLFARGRTADGGQLLQPETLERMWTPQFAAAAASSGYGIGFAVGRLDGHRRIGHGGAIYGFATELAALPDDSLGVVVISTLDVTNAVVEHVADEALRLMLAARQGAPLPDIRLPAPVTPDRAARLAGHYASRNGRSLDLIDRYDTLYLEDLGRYTLRAFGDTLVVDDRLQYGRHLLPLPDGRLVSGPDTLSPAPPAPGLANVSAPDLLGEYGWDHNTLYILEKDGALHALIEWFFEYPLTRESNDVYRFPDAGLYAGEKLVFLRDPGGRVTGVEAASVLFPRRDVGTDEGVTFRITPVRPVEQLRAEALAASPPAESADVLTADLVELATLDSTIHYDIRYASTNNFMGAVFYPEPHAFLQRPAAEALLRAHRNLRQQGLGLLIHDAYRPWFVTKMFWDATPDDMKQFVANPASGSRHNRGAAVDLTLYDLRTGRPLPMVSGYDEFSDRAYPEYRGGTTLQRRNREILRSAMEAEGFRVYQWEWWHFDFGDWHRYAIGNTPFDRLR
ncbi:MAG: serine hydrolase [Gemmatimonadota bacterium]|jgi:CubicO group peptidase (beta-lactamase class C family)/D-alanyl-D-alanine dipeptidase